MVAQKRRRDPGDVEGLEVGAKVSKRFPGYGAAPWEGTVTRIDVDASRFAVAWDEGDETWYAFRLARKMLEYEQEQSTNTEMPSSSIYHST